MAPCRPQVWYTFCDYLGKHSSLMAPSHYLNLTTEFLKQSKARCIKYLLARFPKFHISQFRLHMYMVYCKTSFQNPFAQLAVLLAICQWDMSSPILYPAILLWKLKVPVIKKCFKITHSELKDKPRRLMSSHTDKNCPLCKASSKAFSWMKIFVFDRNFIGVCSL